MGWKLYSCSIGGCMSEKPTWNWGWTEPDEWRLEKQAKYLDSLSEQYEYSISRCRQGCGSVIGSLNTDAGEKLTTAIEDWCNEACITAGQMRAAAASIRLYNNKMITLWEAFKAAWSNYREEQTQQSYDSTSFGGGGGGGGFRF